MASTTRSIKVRILGDDSGLGRALKGARDRVRGFKRDSDRAGAGLSRGLGGGFSLAAASAQAFVTNLNPVGLAIQGIAGAGALAALPFLANLGAQLAAIAPLALVGTSAVAGFVAVQGTLQLALRGVGDAFSAALSGDAKAFSESLRGLSPAARATAVALRGLRPQLQGLQQAVQDRFFRGFAVDLRQVAGNLLPVLGNVLRGTAGQLNQMGRALAGFFRGTEARGLLGNLGSSVNIALASLGNVPAQLASAFLRIGAAAGPTLERISGDISRIVERFAAWTKAGTENGRVAGMIAGAYDKFKQVVRILGAAKNVATRFFGVFTSGNLKTDALTSIETTLRRTADWLGRPENQQKVRDFFTQIRDGVGAVVRFAAAVSAVAGPLMRWTTYFLQLGQVSRSVFSGLFGFLASIGPRFVGAAAGAVGFVSRVVGAVAALPGLLRARVALAFSAARAAIGAGIAVAVGLARSMPGRVAGAVAALVGLLRGRASAAWAAARAVFSAGVAAAVGIARQLPGRAAGAVAALVGLLRGRVAAAFSSARSAAAAGASQVVAVVRSLPGRAAAAVGGLGGRLFGAGAALVQGFINGIRSKIGAVGAAVDAAVQRARDYFPFSPAKRGPFSGRGYSLYSGQALVRDWARGIASQRSAVDRAMGGLLDGPLTGGSLIAGQGRRPVVNVAAPAAAPVTVYVDGLRLAMREELAAAEARTVRAVLTGARAF